MTLSEAALEEGVKGGSGKRCWMKELKTKAVSYL